MVAAGLSFLMGYWNYNHFENHLTARLYKIIGKRVDAKDDKIASAVA